jgi:hypothetical protein
MHMFAAIPSRMVPDHHPAICIGAREPSRTQRQRPLLFAVSRRRLPLCCRTKIAHESKGTKDAGPSCSDVRKAFIGTGVSIEDGVADLPGGDVGGASPSLLGSRREQPISVRCDVPRYQRAAEVD